MLSEIPLEQKKSNFRCLCLSVLLQAKEDIVSDKANIKRRAKTFLECQEHVEAWCRLADVDTEEYLGVIPEIEEDFDFVEEDLPVQLELFDF